MAKKTDGFTDHSIRQAMQLAQSDAGKQLIALLRSADSSQLQAVMDQASAGNFAGAGQALQGMLQTEDAKTLLEQLQQ